MGGVLWDTKAIKKGIAYQGSLIAKAVAKAKESCRLTTTGAHKWEAGQIGFTALMQCQCGAAHNVPPRLDEHEPIGHDKLGVILVAEVSHSPEADKVLCHVSPTKVKKISRMELRRLTDEEAEHWLALRRLQDEAKADIAKKFMASVQVNR